MDVMAADIVRRVVPLSEGMEMEDADESGKGS